MQQLGRYQILKQLGAGGFGAVYLAHDPVIKRDVAIKVFQPKDDNLIAFATSTNTEGLDVLRTRFENEAHILAQLDSAVHVVSVLDFGESDDGSPFYVMPFLSKSLSDLLGKDVFDTHAISELNDSEHPKALPFDHALYYFEQILEGMAAAHKKGLVHRDIKPGNIMLTDDNQVKVVDFGIAKAPDGGHSTVSHLGMGSRNYMAPEQRESAKHVDTRADVYSLGVLAYRMFTGRLPQGRYSDPNIHCPQLPTGINQLILQALSESKAERPQDASALLTAFIASKNDTPESGEGTGTWVGGTEGNEVKAELKPLQQKIVTYLNEYGEIPPKQKKSLLALAQLAALSENQLNDFIQSQIQQLSNTNTQLAAFITFVSRINALAAEGKALDNDDITDMAEASQAATGKSADALAAIIKSKCKVDGAKTSEEKSTQPKTPHTDKPTAPKQPEQPTTPTKPSNKKWLVAAAVALALGGGGYYGFTEYQAAQLAEVQARENQARARAVASEREAQILNAQTQLLQLGYQVVQNGELDTRTQRAIEAFEQNEGMIVTGEVDEVLLAGLTKAITREDTDAWVTASNNNTQASYQTYLAQWPTGSYVEQSNQAIADLKAAAEATANDSRAWQTAQQTNSIASYQAYLTNQPNGAYRNQAQNNINAIELENSKVALSITTTPADATVQIMNIEPPFQNGMRLVPGRYEVKISKEGYTTQSHTVRLSSANRRFNYTLGKALPEAISQLTRNMVTIPAGSFSMGSNTTDREKPIHRVNIASFKLMKTEVTKGMFTAFIDATGYQTDAERNYGGAEGCVTYERGADPEWAYREGINWRNVTMEGHRQNNSHPVVCVSHNDANKFIDWLNALTGQQFRLPTEAEWEYAARAGSTNKYHFGNNESQLCDYANGADLSTDYSWRNTNCNDGYGEQTAPVASFKPNAFGLYDMHGNVWEWTQDCWHGNYQGAPSNGSAWMNSNGGDCSRAVLRGGSWDYKPDYLRSAIRSRNELANRNFFNGFRLAQDTP